jgi:hypothetical protein
LSDLASVSAAGGIFRLWNDNLNVHDRDLEEKFRWYYSNNPSGEGTLFLLTHKNDLNQEEHVGCAGTGPRIFYCQGKPFRASLLADFAVDQGHRTTLPALMLQRNLLKYCQEHVDFSYGCPNAAAMGVFLRIGYHELGKMMRFVRVLNYESYLHKAAFSPIVASGGGRVLNTLAGAVETVRKFRSPAGMTLEWLQEADERFDQLSQAVSQSLPLIGDRGANFLKWRFARKSWLTFDIPVLLQKGTGELIAYAILHEDEGAANIVDLLGRTPDDVRCLLTLLMPELRRRGFSAVSLYFLGAKWMTQLLETQGFQVRGEGKPVIIARSGPSALEEWILHDVENWYFMPTDLSIRM